MGIWLTIGSKSGIISNFMKPEILLNPKVELVNVDGRRMPMFFLNGSQQTLPESLKSTIGASVTEALLEETKEMKIRIPGEALFKAIGLHPSEDDLIQALIDPKEDEQGVTAFRRTLYIERTVYTVARINEEEFPLLVIYDHQKS